jgi:hypothetical protein
MLPKLLKNKNAAEQVTVRIALCSARVTNEEAADRIGEFMRWCWSLSYPICPDLKPANPASLGGSEEILAVGHYKIRQFVHM